MHMTKLPECHTKSICGSQEEASASLCYPVHLALIISVLALILGHAFQLADTLTWATIWSVTHMVPWFALR